MEMKQGFGDGLSALGAQLWRASNCRQRGGEHSTTPRIRTTQAQAALRHRLTGPLGAWVCAGTAARRSFSILPVVKTWLQSQARGLRLLAREGFGDGEYGAIRERVGDGAASLF